MLENKIVIDTCCAHCLAYPHSVLKDKFEIISYFNSSNIHLYTEYKKRREALIEFTKINNIDLVEEPYEIEKWFNCVTSKGEDFTNIKNKKRDRCNSCYELRLENTANFAVKNNISNISSTLLYSTYQYHDLIKTLGEKIAKKYDIKFYYEDFREGWKKGFDLYKPLGLYMQNYCGCIFSEEEKYTS